MAQPFDVSRLELNGEAVPIAERVQVAAANFVKRLSPPLNNGVLAYRRSSEGASRTLVWVSRSGAEQASPRASTRVRAARFSPDGTRVAVQIAEQGNQVWFVDELGRDTLTRLTFDASRNESAALDGGRQAGRVLLEQRGTAESLLADGGWQWRVRALNHQRNPHAPTSVSSDGALLAFTEATGASRDIWVLRFNDRKAQPFLQTPAIEGGAQFSPDGRWMAYVSDESGRPEIYVQPYPGPGGKWQVSTETGGQEPVWNRNGRELFYRSGSRDDGRGHCDAAFVLAGRPKGAL